jgi:hypothetical protein
LQDNSLNNGVIYIVKDAPDTSLYDMPTFLGNNDVGSLLSDMFVRLESLTFIQTQRRTLNEVIGLNQILSARHNIAQPANNMQ